MRYSITRHDDFLAVAVFERKTPEETSEYLLALKLQLQGFGLSKVLISVKESAPILEVESYGFLALANAAREANLKIALTSDSEDIRLSQRYVETLATKRGVNLKAFDSESEATEWLTSPAL